MEMTPGEMAVVSSFFAERDEVPVSQLQIRVQMERQLVMNLQLIRSSTGAADWLAPQMPLPDSRPLCRAPAVRKALPYRMYGSHRSATVIAWLAIRATAAAVTISR